MKKNIMKIVAVALMGISATPILSTNPLNLLGSGCSGGMAKVTSYALPVLGYEFSSKPFKLPTPVAVTTAAATNTVPAEGMTMADASWYLKKTAIVAGVAVGTYVAYHCSSTIKNFLKGWVYSTQAQLEAVHQSLVAALAELRKQLEAAIKSSEQEVIKQLTAKIEMLEAKLKDVEERLAAKIDAAYNEVKVVQAQVAGVSTQVTKVETQVEQARLDLQNAEQRLSDAMKLGFAKSKTDTDGVAQILNGLRQTVEGNQQTAESRHTELKNQLQEISGGVKQLLNRNANTQFPSSKMKFGHLRI